MTSDDYKRLADELGELIPRFRDDQSIIDEAVKVIRAASVKAGEVVAVRPLEWRQRASDMYDADVYSISDTFGQGPRKYVLARGSTILGYFHSADDAKAAAQADYEARIKSALVEVPAVKGEPEPVAWQYTHIKCPDWKGSVASTVRWRNTEGIYQERPLYTAQPADAGMREAFVRVLASLAAAISILERTPKAKKAVASDKIFDTMLDDYRKALEAGRQALTAPGATTKSDGGTE